MDRINKLVIDSTAALSELCELATEFPSDKSPYYYGKASPHRHSYTAVYDFLFAQRRFCPLNIAEIGILDNNSMNVWRAYFPNATLYGFDYDEGHLSNARAQKLPRTHYAHIDVADRSSIFEALNTVAMTLDILIDDSTHLFDHQINVIDIGIGFLSPGGILIIEDVYRGWDEVRYHTALQLYYQYFSAGYFIETNHTHATTEGGIPPRTDNDKLLVLFRNRASIRRQHPQREANRTLLTRVLLQPPSEPLAWPAEPEFHTMASSVVFSPERYATTFPGIAAYMVTHRHHVPALRPEFTTIYCGDAAADRPMGGLSDILSNGTRLLNRRWCELSAIYRIWQDGPRSDIVGFSHYRRYLSFDSSHEPPVLEISSSLAETLCYDATAIGKVSQTYAIVPKPWGVPKLGSVADQYGTWHAAADYARVQRIVADMYPLLIPEFEQQSVRLEMYSCNLFYLCWNHFTELCSFWFSVLNEFCAQTAWPRGNSYQDRDVAFLAERLFDAWIRTKQQAGLQLEERTTLILSDVQS